MIDGDEEPDWDRIAAVCEAVLLRMIEDRREEHDADGGLLPGLDDRAS